MFLSRLSLRDFRNLGVQELVIPREGVAILGDNAQGKSNLLEAIYYLETLRSFRGARDAQLVAFGSSVFRVEADLAGKRATEDGGAASIAAAFDRASREKRVFVGGDAQDRLASGLGHVGAVIFSPDDIRMVNGPPAERRRYLDIVLSLNREGYMTALQNYRRALAQRNAALRAGAGGAGVEVWNRALAQHGSILIENRADWVRANADRFTEHYRAISGEEGASLAYRPSVAAAGGATAADDLLGALEAAESGDLRLRTTTVGPHRDELSMVIVESGLDVREFGSGGQRRTAALALRLIEADTIAAARHVEPIILMDDVFAELDQRRSEQLLERIETGLVGQVILTAPKEADVRVRRDALPRWRIKAGMIAA